MDYRSPAECLELLHRLHPANIVETQRLLSDVIAGLLDAQPAPNQHLEVLEAARAPIGLAQAELAKRYASHPLPPDGVENDTLERVVALWRALAESYAQIARRDVTVGLLADQRALLAQRNVDCAGKALTEYFRAHRAPPRGAWTDLHDSYLLAETQNVAGIRVPDAFNETWKAQSPTEAYVTALLVDLANPFGRSEREFNWVIRWAQRFAPYCHLHPVADADAVKPTAYAVDLADDRGPRPSGLMVRSSPLARRFDANQLAGQIQAVMAQFKQGVKPASLGLGADCPADACAKLLLSLYRPWGLASAGRRFPRRGGQGTVQLCGDWLATGFHVAGRIFEQPTVYATQRSVHSDVSLLTFGERVPQAAQVCSAQELKQTAARLGFTCERWDMADHSVGGFRLRQQRRSERLEHHQLVGIRPPDGERFLLGQVSWLMYREDGVMEAGIHVLPGVPQVAAARLFGLNVGEHVAYQQVFMLPPTPALKAPASLVLPGGWFQPQRVIDLYDGRALQVRLDTLLLRGTNFDQVTFEPLERPARGARSTTGTP